jgi:hypothetical protein
MWYYVRDNERFGPVDEYAIISLIQNGTIGRETLVWKQGMADWQKAEACELAAKFSENFSSTAAYPTFMPGNYPEDSFHKLWLWYTWLICIGTILSVVYVGIFIGMAALVIHYILLYRFWTLIQDGKARTTPGLAVGLCFVPFFNIYWIYVAWVGLAKDTNNYLREKNVPVMPVNENLALAWFIMSLGIIIPYTALIIGVLSKASVLTVSMFILLEIISIASIVIQIVLVKQFANAAKQITLAKSNASQLQ